MRKIMISLTFMVAVVIGLTASAQSTRDRTLTFGDWSVMLTDDKRDLIAVTMQDADKFLAYRCFTSEAKCAHVIVAATGCEDGQKYPMLINASSGSHMVECMCSKNGDSFELLPLDWDGFHNLLTESSGYIGFAIPLQSGHFKVIRFSLNGAKKALETAEVAIRNADTAEYK